MMPRLIHRKATVKFIAHHDGVVSKITVRKQNVYIDSAGQAWVSMFGQTYGRKATQEQDGAWLVNLYARSLKAFKVGA